jgi:hypothetical protein
VTADKIEKCLDPSAFGFELKRNKTEIKFGGTKSNQNNFHPLVDDINPKEKKEVVKSIIIQAPTLEGRNKILGAIKQIKESMSQRTEMFADPVRANFQTKCQCIEVPDHILEK